MNVSRRGFLGALGAAGAVSAFPGCCCLCGATGRVGLQLYSIRDYIAGVKDKKTGKIVKPGVGLLQALKDVKALGYEGVEMAGYYECAKDPKLLKKYLDDTGLVACGTHVTRKEFGPDEVAKTCEFNLAYGNSVIICPGSGNIPPGAKWSTGRGGDPCKPSQAIDDFTKMLCDYYNKAAEDAAKFGCKIGLHNHTWEHGVKMLDGTSFWDYFFTHTSEDVCMEQDVGWTTCAGEDCCAQYVKYPHRSPTLHAKENGMGKDVKEFDAILGQPGKPGATPVPWERLAETADADGVEWWVVECERHQDSFDAIRPSIEFLRGMGRV